MLQGFFIAACFSKQLLRRDYCVVSCTLLTQQKTIHMKKLFLFAVLAAAFSATKMNAQVTPNPDPSAPVIKFKVDTMNFGSVPQGTIVERDFTFKNTGKTPLIITDTRVTCGCTTPDYPK